MRSQLYRKACTLVSSTATTNSNNNTNNGTTTIPITTRSVSSSNVEQRGISPSTASMIATQRRFQASAAAAAAATNNGAAPSVNLDHIPKELRFFVEFEQTEQDLHFELVEEANLKHGVYLNVPPQLPPDGVPPEVPEPIIGEATMARLKALTLAYTPTHAPPPFETCGTRGIDDINVPTIGVVKTAATINSTAAAATTPMRTAGGATAASASPSSSSSASAAAAASPSSSVERKPIDADAKYHCSVCCKPFKLRLAGEHHVNASHDKTLLARLIAGAGEGEIIGAYGSAAAPTAAPAPTSAAAKPNATATATAAATPSRFANVAEEKVQAKKLDYTAAELDLPSELEIEDMLKDVWDAMGLKLKIKDFKESTAIVAGVADKRPPPGSEHLKPSFSATPAGVAPGIKKSTTGKKSLPLNEQGRVMTNKEMTARFPSPFGDSDLFADYEEDDNRNPFLPLEPATGKASAAATAAGASKDIDGGAKGSPLKKGAATASPTAPSPSPSRSFNLTSCSNSQILAKKLTCHMCNTTFRLLDGLHNHYEDVHGTTMPDEVLRASLAINPATTLYEGKIPAARAEAMAAESNNNNNNNSANNNDGEGGSDGTTGSVLGGTGGGSSAADIPIPVEVSDVAIHMRAASNTVLVGDIVEVKRGFIKTHAVTQMIVKVTHNHENGEGGDAARKSDVELITVRCYGDQFGSGPFATELRIGSQVMVNGAMKLNRRLDKVSNRVHAFPYVLVMSPQGSIQLVE